MTLELARVFLTKTIFSRILANNSFRLGHSRVGKLIII